LLHRLFRVLVIANNPHRDAVYTLLMAMDKLFECPSVAVQNPVQQRDVLIRDRLASAGPHFS
jgi:hypothetical protein